MSENEWYEHIKNILVESVVREFEVESEGGVKEIKVIIEKRNIRNGMMARNMAVEQDGHQEKHACVR